jgi:hypothetical protein
VRRKTGGDNVVAEIKKAQKTACLGGPTGFICTEARKLLRRCTFDEFESLAAPPEHGPVNVRTLLIARGRKIGRDNVVAEMFTARKLGPHKQTGRVKVNNM